MVGRALPSPITATGGRKGKNRRERETERMREGRFASHPINPSSSPLRFRLVHYLTQMTPTPFLIARHGPNFDNGKLFESAGGKDGVPMRCGGHEEG